MRFRDLKLGQRVVTAEPSKLFASYNDGKIGTIIRLDEELDRVTLEFADGSEDYGRSEDVTLIPDGVVGAVKLTPAQKLGYKIGDKFRVKSGGCFDKDSIITLHTDDGSVAPLFTGVGTWFRCIPGSNEPGAYESLKNLELVESISSVTVKEKLDQIDKLVSEIRAILY